MAPGSWLLALGSWEARGSNSQEPRAESRQPMCYNIARGWQGLLRHPRRVEDGFRRRSQEGLPQAREEIPPRREQGQQGRGEQVQGDLRGLRGAGGQGEARAIRPSREG